MATGQNASTTSAFWHECCITVLFMLAIETHCFHILVAAQYSKTPMKLVHFAVVAGIALSAPATSLAQVAGSTRRAGVRLDDRLVCDLLRLPLHRARVQAEAVQADPTNRIAWTDEFTKRWIHRSGEALKKRTGSFQT